jgi:hypothetical protein
VGQALRGHRSTGSQRRGTCLGSLLHLGAATPASQPCRMGIVGLPIAPHPIPLPPSLPLLASPRALARGMQELLGTPPAAGLRRSSPGESLHSRR